MWSALAGDLDGPREVDPVAGLVGRTDASALLNIGQGARATLDLNLRIVRPQQRRIGGVTRVVGDPQYLRLPVDGLDGAAQLPDVILRRPRGRLADVWEP